MNSKLIFTMMILIVGVISAAFMYSGIKDNVITGLTAALTPQCEGKCSDNSFCDDGNNCTKDLCLYSEDCEAYCHYELEKDCVKWKKQ